MNATKRFSAHQEMKKNISQTVQKRMGESQKKTARKQIPKRACSGYTEYHKEVFASIKKEEPMRTLKDINKIISSRWKELTAEAKKS